MTGGDNNLTELKFSVLGPVSAFINGEQILLGGPRQVAVLTRLLLSPRRVVSMEQLSETVWEEDIPAQPHIAIRSYISNLRKLLEPHRTGRDTPSCITSIAPGYKIDVADKNIDWLQFENLLSDAQKANRNGELRQASTLAREALRGWKGEPCAGKTYSRTIVSFRNRLQEQHLNATELVINARIQLGEHKDVIPELETLIAANPLRERLTELAMLALYLSGRQSEALSLANSLRNHLLEELGINPSQVLNDLEVKILNQDPSLKPKPLQPPQPPQKPPTITPPEIPKPVIDFRDQKKQEQPPSRNTTKHLFLGRNEELQALQNSYELAQETEVNMCLITGDIGTGKTNLVKTFINKKSEETTTATGTCLANDSTWLWVWTEAIAQLLKLLNNEEKQELVNDHQAIISVAPQLSRYAKGEFEKLSPKAHTFAAVQALIYKCSEYKQLTIFLDDLQLADRDSIDLLQYLVSRISQVQVLFIGAYRSTSLHKSQVADQLEQLCIEENLTTIHLDALETKAIAKLIEETEATKLNGLESEIARFTGSNPLFVSETIKALKEQNKSKLTGLKLTRRCIQSVIARIKAINPYATTILAIAANLDKEINAANIAENCDIDQGKIKDTLEMACFIEILEKTKNGYKFTTTLIQQAVLQAKFAPTKTLQLESRITAISST